MDKRTRRAPVPRDPDGSERRFGEMFSANPHPIWVYSLKTLRFLDVNAAAVATYGWSRAEFLAMTLADIRPAAEVQRLLDELARPARGEGINAGLWKHRTKDGAILDMEITSHPVKYGERGARMVFAHDVTERRRAERALRESEARYRALTRLSSDWYWEQDADYRFVATEGMTDARAGITAAVHLGKRRWELPGTEIVDQTWDEHRAVLAARQPFRDLLLRRTDSGSATHYVEISGEPVFDEQGRFTGYRGIANEVTERKRAEARIARQTQLYSALSECNKAIVHSAGEAELFSSICNTAVRINEIRTAWIGVVDPGSNMIRVAARAGERADEFLQGIEISVDAGSPLAHGPTGTAIRENRPVWCQDIGIDPATVFWRERAARAGWAAVASLPLRCRDRVVGAFVLCAGEPGTFDEEERDLLVEMASDVGFALGNFDREARRKRAKRQLEATEGRFRGLVEQSIAGIYILQTGKLVYANPRCAEIIGQGSADEVIGTEPFTWIIEADHERVAEGLRQLLAGEAKNIALEFGVRHRDGSTIQVGAHAAIATHMDRPAIIGLVQDISEKKRAEQEIERYVAQLKIAFMSTVEVATTISEMRDPYTAGHERRVAQIACAIGAELGLDAHRQEGLRVAGHLHDIGKITIPAEILSKPGKLLAIEFSLIKGHSQASYDVLRRVEFPWPVADIALQHHERMDGSGYPQGLSGEAILFEARIMAVADTVEAMSSHRPYRPGLGIEVALAQIEKDAGTKLDAEVVAACVRLFREKGFRLPL